MAEIEYVRRVPWSDMHGTIRTFGVSGPLGSFGQYQNKKLGNFKMYKTQNKNLFLFKVSQEKKIVISCSQPDKLIEYLKQKNIHIDSP